MTLSTAQTDDARPAQTFADRAIRIWLAGVALLVFVMVIVGGATRLTDSGLSITEWQPIVGFVPPLSDADWQEAFAKYQQIPEYQQINKGMSLDQFKIIFWWEWAHRFLGRIIGLAFLLPFLFFLVRGWVRRDLMPRLIGLFVLGGLQGVLGWYMVMSGLADRVDVSQYRLAAHLALAAVIFAAILWVALDIGAHQPRVPVPRRFLLSASGLLGLIFLQIILGAFVAGLDAGLSHNTWPLMDGKFVPDGLGAMSPWYLNLFENVLTVQFNHRMAAYATGIWALAHAAVMLRWDAGQARSALWLAGAVLAQIGIGVWTLLAQVPIWLGLMHQAGAFIVLALAVHHLHGLRAQPPRTQAPAQQIPT